MIFIRYSPKLEKKDYKTNKLAVMNIKKYYL